MITRYDFLLPDRLAFLNHGSFGLCPQHLLNVQREWQVRLEQQPVLFHRELPGLMHEARSKAAAYLGARTKDLVLITNSTFGVNVMAHAMKGLLEGGDRILVTDHEYGACIRAWRMHLEGTGIELDTASIPIPAPSQDEIFELITARVTDRTKALFFSHITSPTAIRFPAERLCAWARERGILTIVDGSHVPAHLDLDLTTLGADAYTGNFHKWMCTPKGSAFLWVREGLQERVRPLVVSWGDLEFTVGEGPFIDNHEYLGTRDPSAFLTIPAALTWMDDHDWGSIQERARTLRDEAMRALLKIDGVDRVSEWEGDQLQMGAVTLPNTVHTAYVKERLYDDHAIEVVVMPWLGKPILRFSVHVHTREDDLRRLTDVLPAYL